MEEFFVNEFETEDITVLEANENCYSCDAPPGCDTYCWGACNDNY